MTEVLSLTKVKCRYCKKEIDRDNAYSVTKGQYFCNEEHYKLKEQEKKPAPKPTTQNFRVVTDYLVELFGSQPSSYWSNLNRMLKRLNKNGMLYSGMYGTLRYYREVLDKSFSENPFGIIAVIEDYYEEAKAYQDKTREINRIGEEFPNDKIRFVKPNIRKKEDKRVIDMEKL